MAAVFLPTAPKENRNQASHKPTERVILAPQPCLFSMYNPWLLAMIRAIRVLSRPFCEKNICSFIKMARSLTFARKSSGSFLTSNRRSTRSRNWQQNFGKKLRDVLGYKAHVTNIIDTSSSEQGAQHGGGKCSAPGSSRTEAIAGAHR